MTRRVKLKWFNDTAAAPEGCKPQENYWLLIDQAGEVVASANERNIVLVKFETQISSFGLHCYNEVYNCLFMLEADLEPLK